MIPDRNFIFDGVESAVTECLKAIICQVHTYCYGAHFQIALGADIVVAAEGTLFTHPAFTRGAASLCCALYYNPIL